jgi:DNA-binding SARP family transcriptional activator
MTGAGQTVLPRPEIVAQAVVVDAARTTDCSRAPEPERNKVNRIDVTLLGGFEIRVDGRPVASRHWSRRHGSALVKLLAMSPGRSLHRELVIDALWPDIGIDDAAPRLHKAAHYARNALDHRDAVVLSADAVSLCPYDDVVVDMVQFRQLAESALSEGSIATAKGALAVYGGELLPQDLYEPWAEHHRPHLRRLYLELLHQAEDWHQVLAAEPADEAAHLALAQRYAERGHRVAALRQLDQLDRVIRQELGLEPSEHALRLRRHLAQAAYQHNPIQEMGATCHEPPPSPATDARQHCCA